VWGLALAAQGAPAADVDAHLEAARDVFMRTGQRLALARLAFARSHVVRVRGDNQRADALRAEGAAIFREGGAPELVEADA